MIILVVFLFSVVRFFFFKQKTAYEMRISDWSSDVCSSDLTAPPQVPSLRFASGVPQGRRRAFGWHKSHPQAPPCVLRAGNRLLHPLIARRNFAVGTALCGNMRPYELGVSNP